MRLEKKDLLLLIPATLLAIAGLGPEDPWVVGPCLLFSWLTFIIICVIPDGSRKARIIVGVVITLALGSVGYRRFNSILHAPEKAEAAKKEPPQASATTTLQLIPPPGGWLREWGAPIPPLGVRSVVDLSTLIPYKKPIPLMLVYWIVDDTVDEQNETRIVKSNIFTVAGNPRLTIDVQLYTQFLARVAPQKSEKLIVPMKVALLALPRTARPDDISRISDASKLGGSVLTVNGFPFPVEAKVTKLHP